MIKNKKSIQSKLNYLYDSLWDYDLTKYKEDESIILIGDILEYIDFNKLFLEKHMGNKYGYRDIIRKTLELRDKKNKKISEQSKECINHIYDMVSYISKN